jgi:hypothetical protein
VRRARRPLTGARLRQLVAGGRDEEEEGAVEGSGVVVYRRIHLQGSQCEQVESVPEASRVGLTRHTEAAAAAAATDLEQIVQRLACHSACDLILRWQVHGIQPGRPAAHFAWEAVAEEVARLARWLNKPKKPLAALLRFDIRLWLLPMAGHAACDGGGSFSLTSAS